jgi:hypothetical protein
MAEVLMDVRAIVNDYYKELQKVIKTGTLDASKFHFADNVVIEGPAILATEIITVKNGSIVRMDVVFDTKQWALFMAP